MTIPNYDRRIKTGKSQPENLEYLKILVLNAAKKALWVFVFQVFTLKSTHFVDDVPSAIMFARKTRLYTAVKLAVMIVHLFLHTGSLISHVAILFCKNYLS